MKTIAFLGVALLLISVNVLADNRPSGYVTICSSSKPTCSVTSPTNVAFGRSGQFTYKILNGNFSCDELTFGAGTKISGGVNECSIPNNRHSSSSSSSSQASSGSSSSSDMPNRTITGGTCVSTGVVQMTQPIDVTSGVYDGQCKTFIPPDGIFSDGADFFRVANGATLKNIIIGKSSNFVGGIRVLDGGTLDNITILELDSIGIRIVNSSRNTITSNVNVTRLSVKDGDDSSKIFQVNGMANLNISNCIANGVARFLRQNGGTTFLIKAKVDRCEISNINAAVFHSDSAISTVELTNSYLRNTPTVCLGAWRSCTSSNTSVF